MKMDTAISVKSVSKKYKLYNSPKDRLKEAFHPRRKKYHKDFWALRDISFNVPKGTTIGIIGQNGCGKSTLLQIICGIVQPFSGHVNTNGRISALLELGAGFNPDFTGRQNVYMSGAVKGFTKKEMDERFDDIVSFADIGNFIEQPVKTYSSGMYVRLAFACAVNVDPDILVVDEALAVGDASFQRKCFERMKQLKAKKTILYVSHAIPSVRLFCDQVIWLDKGHIVNIGHPIEVTNQYLKYIQSLEKEELKKKDTIGANQDHVVKIREFRLGNLSSEDGIMTGQDLIFSFVVEIDEPTTINIGMAINRNNDQCLTRVSTARDGVVLQDVKGLVSGTLTIPDNDLLEGDYSASLYVGDSLAIYSFDRWVDRIQFTIKTPINARNIPIAEGIVRMKHSWTFENWVKSVNN